jgi:hypothetical protein
MMRNGRTPDSHLGGASFQALVEVNCRANPSTDKKTDQIIFQTAFRDYDRCQFRYECTE